jgi:hypothetical protein
MSYDAVDAAEHICSEGRLEFDTPTWNMVRYAAFEALLAAYKAGIQDQGAALLTQHVIRFQQGEAKGRREAFEEAEKVAFDYAEALRKHARENPKSGENGRLALAAEVVGNDIRALARKRDGGMDAGTGTSSESGERDLPTPTGDGKTSVLTSAAGFMQPLYPSGPAKFESIDASTPEEIEAARTGQPITSAAPCAECDTMGMQCQHGNAPAAEEKCRRCGGFGIVPANNEDKEKPCPGCKGTGEGTGKESQDKCSNCGGPMEVGVAGGAGGKQMTWCAAYCLGGRTIVELYRPVCEHRHTETVADAVVVRCTDCGHEEVRKRSEVSA